VTAHHRFSSCSATSSNWRTSGLMPEHSSWVA
jgi:hypothetical protein